MFYLLLCLMGQLMARAASPPTIWWCPDPDGDGYTTGLDAGCLYTNAPPAGWVRLARSGDCDANNASVYPGTVTISTVSYASTQEAIDTATAGDTVLLCEVTAGGLVVQGKTDLTIHGGTFSSNGQPSITIRGSTGITLNNMEISGSRAVRGSAVYILNSDVSLRNLDVQGNTSPVGVIYVRNSYLYISSTYFRDNVAGISLVNSDLEVENGSFYSNDPWLFSVDPNSYITFNEGFDPFANTNDVLWAGSGSYVSQGVTEGWVFCDGGTETCE